jgi:serine/threonine protein phosphatase PrpC
VDSFTGTSFDGLPFLDIDTIIGDTDVINAPSQPSQHFMEEKKTEWNEGKSTAKFPVEQLLDNIASSFELDNKEEKPVTDTVTLHQPPALVSPTTPFRPTNSVPMSVKSQSDHDSLRFSSRRDSAPSVTPICDGTAPPADFVDPKDGHIWRSKYCVLDEDILYFYRNASDGESQEAKLERRKSLHLYETTPKNASPEDDNLSKSPTPWKCLVNSFKPDTVAIYEKRVFLDRVGAVRSTQEYGECSFELLAGEPENGNAKLESDKLVLRARNPEEMREWLFQFLRYLASLVKNSIETVGGGMTVVGSPPAHDLGMLLSPRSMKPQAGPPTLFNGHGLSALRREQSGDLKGSPSSTPRGSPSQLALIFGQASYVIPEATPSCPPEACPQTERPPPRPANSSKNGKYVLPHRRKKCDSVGSKPGRSPHLSRQNGAASAGSSPHLSDETIASGSLSTHIQDFPSSAPTHYDAVEGIFEMSIDEPRDELRKEALHRTEERTVEPAGRLFSPFTLGGCADRSVVVGSILDPMFKSSSASNLGQVRTEDYGGFGGGKHAKDTNGVNANVSLKWEIGAVSKCGKRKSNEDSYLVASDLMKGFESLSADQNGLADLPTWAESGSHQPGLFCVFDGHNGNHAARFAAEKLPHFLLTESRVNSQTDRGALQSVTEAMEEILFNAIGSLDDAFCRLCTEDGRDWESGATALIALVAHEHLVLGHVGDCRGVMCRSMDADDDMKDGWSKLEHTDEAANVTFSCFFREVNAIHSPSRPDEHERIRKANGWITVETEIPIGQVKWMDFEDEDVVEILKRWFKDRNFSSSAPQHLIEISRVCGDLAVSRALGDPGFKAAFNDSVPSSSDLEWLSPVPCLLYPEEHSHRFKGDLVSAVPELQRLKLAEKGVYNEFLLLACDGLWDVMDPDDAIRIARGLLYEKKWEAKRAAGRLAELAIHLGSSDNVTVIVVRFFKED